MAESSSFAFEDADLDLIGPNHANTGRRFVNEDVSKMISDQKNHNTTKKTKHDSDFLNLKCFLTEEKGEFRLPEDIPPPELNIYLSEFINICVINRS